MKGFKNANEIIQDERYFQDRSHIQTHAIEAVEAVMSFTGLTESELREELVKITSEYRERLADLRRAMIVNKIAE